MYDTLGYWWQLPWSPSGDPRQKLTMMLEHMRAGGSVPITDQQKNAMVADLVRFFLVEFDSSKELQKEVAELVVRTLLPGELYIDPTVLFQSPLAQKTETRGRPSAGTMEAALSFEFGFLAKNKSRISTRELAKLSGVDRKTISRWRKSPEYAAEIEGMGK